MKHPNFSNSIFGSTPVHHPKAGTSRHWLSSTGNSHWIVFAVAFAALGSVLLFVVHAATIAHVVTVAPQSGQVTGNASVVSNSTAIGGKALKFGSGSGSVSTAKSAVGGSTTVAPPKTTTTTGGSGSPSSSSSVEPVGIAGTWTLKFDDEFSSDKSLNTTDWTTNIEQGDSTENNVKVSPANVSVSGGTLNLTLSSSTEGANVSTDPSQGIKGFTFGDGFVAEARIYFPGNGTDIYNWPAFWTVNNDWPQDGENDVAEGNGPLTTNYHGTNEDLAYTPPGTWSNGWHTYAIDREAGESYIYWDGKLVKTYATDDGGAPHYLTLNVGNSTGPTCSCGGTSVYGAASTVKVSYVRVWEKS